MNVPDPHGSGYVYLIWAETGHYKIGRAFHIGRRFKLITIELPIDIKLVHYIPVEDMAAAEKKLHRRFRNHRVRGEWFSLGEADVEYIKGLTTADFPSAKAKPVRVKGAKKAREKAEAGAKGAEK